MSKYLLFLLLLLGITAKAKAQEMMLNGSFEECDGVVPSDSDPYSIEYAAYYHNIIGTSDLIHPCPPYPIAGTPCFGIGAGRFGITINGYTEFFYGTTLPLTAGQDYEVSFWIRKDYATQTIRKAGLTITDYVPTSSITSVTPLISKEISSTQCVKLKACFTAQSNATHYVTIGPFGGMGTTEPILYLVDSISVMTIPPNAPYVEPHVTASKTTYCLGDQVLLDGSASQNETSHQWKIFHTNNGNNLVYNSGEVPGAAGTLNATNLLSFLQPGSCYRAELTGFGLCEQTATVDFCFQSVDINFITDGNPVCENLPVDLQVTGDNGWTYSWSTGQSGTGLKSITVTPVAPSAQYSVLVTTPEGCTFTRSITLNVSSQNNVAPWMNGINGTGEYTYYVQQGDVVSFNSLLSNDHPNELIEVSTSNTIPSGFLANPPATWGSVFSFNWVTSLATPVGEYHYILTVNDKNACSQGVSTFDFRIIVVCDQCPVCVGYENRSPSGTPLPAETKAGKCIEAGVSATVSTGTANVLFQAGSYILEGPYFEAGPGYEAVIDPSTCVTDCEDCCTDWEGFTYDPLPNPFYMNFTDSDPTNDFIQITDTYHPFCAFGAKGYSFEVLNRWGNLVNNGLTSVNSSACCKFESPAPEHPIAHSSIWWNGYTLNLFNNWVRPSDGVYTYILTLTGCNGQTLTVHGSIQIGGLDPNALMLSGEQQSEAAVLNPVSEEHTAALAAREVLDQQLDLYPNPTTDQVQITGAGEEELYYQVFDEKGTLLTHRQKAVNQCFSLAAYSKGMYYIWLYSGNAYVVRKVVKM